jgi:hypothetical protein
MKKLTLPAILLISLISAPAAISGEGVNDINSRLENQSGRIGDGLGQKKHKKDEKKLMRADDASYKIEAQEQAMRTRHGGKLTRHDQRVLNRRLNRNSRRIHNGKNEN